VFGSKRPLLRSASFAAASLAVAAGVAPAATPPTSDPGTPTMEEPASTPTTTVPATPTTVATPPPTPPTTPTTAPDTAAAPTPAAPDTTAVLPPIDPAGAAAETPSETPSATPDASATPDGAAPQPAPAPRNVIVRGSQLAYVLATIRHIESGGDYTVGPNRGAASGAYQFITRTWANYAGYPEAYLAPPWVQDERAAADVTAILRTWRNDVSMVPIIWYYPAAARDPGLLDVVPVPQAGNVLTVREYQRRWLDAFTRISGKPLPPSQVPMPPGLELLSGIPPVVPEATTAALSLAFPVLGPSEVAPPPACPEGATCDGPRDAIVFGRALQPVLAVADGVVTDVQLGDRPTGPGSHEVSVTVTDVLGRSYRYGGLNDDNPGTDDGAAPRALRVTGLAEVGRTVRAGQIIGFMGTTDPVALADGSGAWPHLRLSISDLAGNPLDAEGPVVAALFRQLCTTGIGQWSVPPNRATADAPLAPLVVESDDGAWWITGTGQLVAIGDAALIHPTDACGWQPDTPHGPGAGGNVAPPGFADEIVLPIEVWLAVLGDDDAVRPSTPWRRGA
jgi:hypothetical protein